MGKSSKFRGVCWDKRAQKWKASISIDGKQKNLGYFADEETAARKYDEHAAHLGWLLNFPSEGQTKDLEDIRKVKGKIGKRKRKNDGSPAPLAGSSESHAEPKPKVMNTTSSKFRGVSWYKPGQKWLAQISIDGKQTHLGRFDDEETAARKYDEHADRLGRPLNFPSEGKLQDHAIRTSNWAQKRELLVQKRDRLIAHEHSCHSACVRKVAVENDEALQNLAPESSRVEQLDSMVRPLGRLGSIQRDLKQVTLGVVGRCSRPACRRNASGAVGRCRWTKTAAELP